MTGGKLENVTWFVDQTAKSRGEPGIYHSYCGSLATAINYMDSDVDPTWLMGASGFAFRLFVNEVLCPSAMSIFDWASILPEAVEQAGRQCVYVSRLWDESDKEEERRAQAHKAIAAAIERGTPAVVWDVADCEWGLIIGHNDQAQSYDVLDHHGRPASLGYDKLGQRGIKILSVAIPGSPNGRDREDILYNALRTAVAHATQQEWTERPKYENGLAAYDLWASALEKWAAVLAAGKGERIGFDVSFFATYNAGHHYSARCYAREFLRGFASRNEALHEALLCYEEVTARLKPVWDCFSQSQEATPEILTSLADSIRGAKASEARGVDAIKRYLAAPSGGHRS
jgi:hypothetical protein